MERFEVLPVSRPGAVAIVAASRRSFDRHTHDEFGFGFIDQGAQRWHSGRRLVEAGAGAVIMCNPGEVHDGSPIGDDGRCWRMLWLTPAAVERACQQRAGGYEFSDAVRDDRRIAVRMRRLFAVATSAAGDALEHDVLLFEVLREIGGPVGNDARGCPGRIARAIARIDDQPQLQVTLAELAREACISVWQLLRSFKEATGFTPHAYLLQRRIELARRLIARGKPLAAAAAGSGFADQAHMTRVFRRKYGLSPSTWAAAIR